MAQFADNTRISTVTAPGATMRVAQQGDGPDIVWVPGGDATAEYRVEQLERFSGEFRCTSHDPRGVGHVSFSRHRPDVVAAALREIIAASAHG